MERTVQKGFTPPFNKKAFKKTHSSEKLRVKLTKSCVKIESNLNFKLQKPLKASKSKGLV